MTSLLGLAAAAALVTATLCAGCGDTSPALDASGTKAFTYDVVHRHFAGDVYAGSDKTMLLNLGQALCGQLDKGRTVAQLNDGLTATKSLKATATDDAKFVSTAVATLCPKYMTQVLSASGPSSSPAPSR